MVLLVVKALDGVSDWCQVYDVHKKWQNCNGDRRFGSGAITCYATENTSNIFWPGFESQKGKRDLSYKEKAEISQIKMQHEAIATCERTLESVRTCQGGIGPLLWPEAP